MHLAKRIFRRVKRVLRRLGLLRAEVNPKFDLSRPYEDRFPARYDTRFFDLGDGAQLAVYWKDLPLGIGPALSVHIGASEPLKFDCFGPRDGHFHTEIPRQSPGGGGRLWLPEPSRGEQVDRALFEISENLEYYLRRSHRAEAQSVVIDPDLLREATHAARDIAHGFIRDNPEMRNGGPRSTPASKGAA